MGRGWDGGGIKVPTLAGARTGAPLLGLEGQRAVGSRDWNQLCWCCKGAEYFCQCSKIIRIDCTQIGTSVEIGANRVGNRGSKNMYT